MAKFAGSVGFITEVESSPGIWTPSELVQVMYGDVLRTASTLQGSSGQNKNIVLQHRISLVGDPHAIMNFYDIRWVEYQGAKWEVTLIEVARPRIIVTLGGIWNG